MRVNTHIISNKKFMEILNSVIGQMSDGIWENTRSMEKYWRSIDVYTNEDDEIIIDDTHNVCTDVCEFMANKIKQIIKIEREDGNSNLEWSRNNSAKPNYIGYGENITVGDCYQLYDLLKGRNDDNKTYSTYGEYTIKITLDGNVVTKVTVEAPSEYQAKAIAQKQLLDKLRFEILK